MTEKIPFLYTPEQKRKRDSSIWTIVQGVLAPLQFLVFLISLSLVIRFLMTGNGYETANYSILIKTAFLLVIMITGSIWEKVVFGKYLFADTAYVINAIQFIWKLRMARKQHEMNEGKLDSVSSDIYAKGYAS